MLVLEDVSKTFYSGFLGQHRVDAVKHFSLTVGKGQAVGLVGPSGSGKSTVGRLIVRLLEPTAGTIYYGGEKISQLSLRRFQPYRQKIQIIFQHPQNSLNPKHSIYQALAEPLRLFRRAEGGGNKRVKERVRELLEMVNLQEELLFRYPSQLSGGQLQRLALARVLALEPELIVADEPTSMLDISVQAQIIALLKSLQQEKGISFLFISHDRALVRAFCRRAVEIREGMLQRVDVQN